MDYQIQDIYLHSQVTHTFPLIPLYIKKIWSTNPYSFFKDAASNQYQLDPVCFMKEKGALSTAKWFT